MKKSQMYKKVNRKAKLFSHVNRNVVYPTVYLNPNRDEDVYNRAIEITELTSDEDASDNEQNNNHEWCNITDRSHEKEDDYEVNKSARDKRRGNNENDYRENFTRHKCNDEDVLNQFCTDFYGIDFHDRSEGISTVNNLHPEFITIIKNKDHRASDTSSDSNQYDNIEVVQCDDTKENDYWNSDDFYDSRNINDNDGNAEKRTIWIYALKNQRYLSEHDYELINIPSKDSTSTTDDEDLIKDIPNSRRIATPIPAYIPRMNFSISPKLPTVTELTEPNKHPSNNSDISTKSADKDNTTLIGKSSNVSFENDTTKTQNDNQIPEKIETNYESRLQSLTPRERRRLRQTKINEQNIPDTEKGPETREQKYCEPKIIIHNKELSPELQIDKFRKQKDEIDHEDDQDNGINNEKEVSLEHSNDCTLDESLCNLRKPRIKLSSETKTSKKDITDPIEKLDGNWIGNSLPNDNELFEVYDYDVTVVEDIDEATQRTGEGCASDRLLIRNMSLLKPAEWTQYLPLTGSVPSLHLSLSIDTDFDTEKKSWFKRLIQFVHCCK